VNKSIKEAGAVVLRLPTRNYALTLILLPTADRTSNLAAKELVGSIDATAGVRGDLFHVRAPIRKAQNLGAQAHFGLEIRILLDLSEPGVLFLSESDVS
jgi:hypothetical protein